MRHLLMAHQQESFHPFSARQCLSCFLSRMAKGSNPKPRGPNSPPKPHGPNLSQATWPSKRHVVPKRDAKWLPYLGINLPLQPHFQVLPQLTTAAIISGRYGPVVWSQLSASSSGPHYKTLFGAPLLAALCYTFTYIWNL